MLKTLLADLDEGEDDERAFSSTWTHDSESRVATCRKFGSKLTTFVATSAWGTAMETIKTLSRSATGKTQLTTVPALRILLRHAGIPLDSASSSASSSSSPSRLDDIPLKVRKEALSTVANTLFLHSSTTLSSLSTLDAGRAFVKQLRTEQGQPGNMDDTLVFLFGRILMWMTASREFGFLQDLVDEQGLVQAIKTVRFSCF